MINHAIILAAGRGIRLMPLTKKIPKAMVKIKNQTLILKGIKKVQKYADPNFGPKYPKSWASLVESRIFNK